MIASSADEFIEKINSLIEDEQKYLEICRNALALVNNNFTWDAVNHPLSRLLQPVEQSE